MDRIGSWVGCAQLYKSQDSPLVSLSKRLLHINDIVLRHNK